jgi:hypothetical protein
MNRTALLALAVAAMVLGGAAYAAAQDEADTPVMGRIAGECLRTGEGLMNGPYGPHAYRGGGDGACGFSERATLGPHGPHAYGSGEECPVTGLGIGPHAGAAHAYARGAGACIAAE